MVIQKKAVPLQPQKENCMCRKGLKGEASARKIGVWCNGNTADSGPAFPGSSPGTPTFLGCLVLEISAWQFFFVQVLTCY